MIRHLNTLGSSYENCSQKRWLKAHPDASCPEGKEETDWDSPHTSLPVSPESFFWIDELRTASWAALAIDSWVYWNWTPCFQFTSVRGLWFAWAHIRDRHLHSSISGCPHTQSQSQLFPSRLFKQGLLGVEHGRWGEAVHQLLKLLIQEKPHYLSGSIEAASESRHNGFSAPQSFLHGEWDVFCELDFILASVRADLRIPSLLRETSLGLWFPLSIYLIVAPIHN